MKRIVIIGQSVTAVKAIEQIRSVDPDSEVVMLGFGQSLPFLQEHLPDWLAGTIDTGSLIYKNEKFYHNLRVEYLTDKRINRIHFRKKTIFFDDKEKMEADIFIIADTDRDRFPDIKGTNKTGVFSLRTMEQGICLKNFMGRIGTVVVESLSLRGALIAKSLLAQNKEVIFCVPGDGILSGALDHVISDFLITLLEQAGVRVIRHGSIQEILGDEDVKAVRLNTGKVIAAEAVLFPDAAPDMRLYRKEDLEVGEYIQTDRWMKTSCDDVFALDGMTSFGNAAIQFCDYENLRNIQAGRVASIITNTEYVEQPIIRNICMQIAGHELIILGEVCGGSDIIMVQDEDGFIRAHVFLKNNIVQGAFLVDNINISSHIRDLIEQKIALDPGQDSFLSQGILQKHV